MLKNKKAFKKTIEAIGDLAYLNLRLESYLKTN